MSIAQRQRARRRRTNGTKSEDEQGCAETIVSAPEYWTSPYSPGWIPKVGTYVRVLYHQEMYEALVTKTTPGACHVKYLVDNSLEQISWKDGNVRIRPLIAEMKRREVGATHTELSSEEGRKRAFRVVVMSPSSKTSENIRGARSKSGRAKRKCSTAHVHSKRDAEEEDRRRKSKERRKNHYRGRPEGKISTTEKKRRVSSKYTTGETEQGAHSTCWEDEEDRKDGAAAAKDVDDRDDPNTYEWEVAMCSPTFVGDWTGGWEPCRLLDRINFSTTRVRCVDGKECDVDSRFLRRICREHSDVRERGSASKETETNTRARTEVPESPQTSKCLPPMEIPNWLLFGEEDEEEEEEKKTTQEVTQGDSGRDDVTSPQLTRTTITAVNTRRERPTTGKMCMRMISCPQGCEIHGPIEDVKRALETSRTSGRLIIGRAKTSDIRLQRLDISRRHLILLPPLPPSSSQSLDMDVAVRARDVSSNGVYIGSERMPANEDVPIPLGADLIVGGDPNDPETHWKFRFLRMS